MTERMEMNYSLNTHKNQESLDTKKANNVAVLVK